MDKHSVGRYFFISVFAIFLGSQITEGVLMVPYWRSLSADEFYSYYGEFGPSISQFYTILTIAAALISISVAIKFQLSKSKGAGLAVFSAVFAMLFILCFYVYFKGVNESFYQRALDPINLKEELKVWSSWHWSRIGLEIISLSFLIAAFTKDRSGNHS